MLESHEAGIEVGVGVAARVQGRLVLLTTEFLTGVSAVNQDFLHSQSDINKIKTKFRYICFRENF